MKMPKRKKKRQKIGNKSEQSAKTVAGFCRNDMTSLEESSATLDGCGNKWMLKEKNHNKILLSPLWTRETELR